MKDLEEMPASYRWEIDANDKNVKAKELYDKFLSFNGYKESTAYLSRFVVVPDALFMITTSQTDAFGQTSEYTHTYAHLYSSYGERVDSCPLFELLGVELGSEPPLIFLSYEYEYDTEGVIKSIVFWKKLDGGAADRILCKTALERDNRGNIISATTMAADGDTLTSTYVYNEKNLLISATVYEFCINTYGISPRPDLVSYDYIYNENGKLIEESKNRGYGPFTTRYEYDEQGFLIKETGSYESREYTYDKNGKISTVKVTTDDGKSYTQIYHYETLYLYFPEK